MSAVEAAVERALDRWRRARERQARIEAPWGLPPPVPVLGDWRAAFDPTGRFALLIGYRAVHLLDLRAATTRVLVEEGRDGRAGAFAPDGRSAVVVDGYGGFLYRVDLAGEPRVETHRWSCPRPLRGELAVALDGEGRVAVVGTDLDEAPLHVLWLDAASGETLEARTVPAERISTAGALGGLRATADGLHLWLQDPETPAIEVDRGDPAALRRPPPRICGGDGHWRAERAGKRWRLVGDRLAIDIERPRQTPVVALGSTADRVAVAVDGRVRVYDAGGAPIGEGPEPPGRRRFTTVRAMLLDGDRLWVHGDTATSPFGAEPRSLVAGYRLDAGAWAALGVVLLADRVLAAKPGEARGERLSNVYVKGVQQTVAQLEAKGINFIGASDPEGAAAQKRFARERTDPYPRELPFARSPMGLFGRLDADRGIGPAAVAPFERPAVARAILRGEAPPLGPATHAALDDWLDRLRFWRAEDRWSKPEALGRLMEASAGLGDLLPEIVHRAPVDKDGGPPKASALVRIAGRMQRRSATDREAFVFGEMLDRERERLLPALRRARLASACPALDGATLDRAVDALGATVETVADTAEAGGGILTLRGVADGAALAELLAAASADLRITTLDLAGCGLDDDGVARLAAARWPTLRHLDLSGTGITDRGAAALAASQGLPALATLTAEGTALTDSGRAMLEWAPGLPAFERTLAPLAAWAGLLGAEACSPATLDALWDATADGTDVTADGMGLRWRGSGAPHLEIDGVAICAAGARALADVPRTLGLRRLALRGCGLDDAAAEPLLALTSLLDAPAELDLSHNTLGRGFTLGAVARGPATGCSVDLTGNPLEPGDWGALRCALGARLRGVPDGAPAQLAAAAALGQIPLDERIGLLGRAFARDPGCIAPTLDALDGLLGPEPLRAVLTSPTVGGLLPRAAWPALTARVVDLAGHDPATWTLWPVWCRLEGEALRLAPEPALTEVQLEAEPDDSRLRKLLSGQDVLTGDEDFDRVALIAGDPATALAVLDPQAREALIRWLPAGLTLRDGVVDCPGVRDPAAIAELARLAARLVTPSAPLMQLTLATRLADEPVAGVAVRLAEALVAADAGVPSLDTAAASGAEKARRIIGEALARQLGPENIDQIGPAGLAAALDPAPAELRLPIIRRLAAIGDERAVAPLTGLARAFFGSGAVKEAARAAIEAIVERQGGLRAGGLTVVGGDARGGLSTPGDDET